MDDNLLHYYERELTYIRELGSEFARKYPKIAGRLLLENDKCEDPHTERIIEAFAFLCARIHKKLDDDLPEITESLLSIIYPHYLNPIPSMSIVKFDPIKQSIPPTGYHIPRDTALFSKPVGGTACQFSTTYPLTIWPVEVASAGLKDPAKQVKGAVRALTIKLKTYGSASLSEIGWDRMRFYLNGPHQHVFHLYELLFNNVCHVECQVQDKKGKQETLVLDPQQSILPVGFGDSESMLPHPQRSFPGYILLFEYFCFPEKFLFFDLAGLGRLKKPDLGDTLDITFYLDKVPKSDLVVNKDTFCINAVPAINIFERVAEPVRIDRQKTEYRVIPDMRRQAFTEIFQIDRVVSSPTGEGQEAVEYRPFYSVRHHLEDTDMKKKKVFWHMQRRPSEKKGDNGSDVFLSFADIDFRPADPSTEVITVYTSCTNRDLPARLPFGDVAGDFDMESAGPVAKIHSLIKPTPTRRPALGRVIAVAAHLASVAQLPLHRRGRRGRAEGDPQALRLREQPIHQAADIGDREGGFRAHHQAHRADLLPRGAGFHRVR